MKNYGEKMTKLLESQMSQGKDLVLCEMIRFQTDRGLDKKEFNIDNEMQLVMEELLEAKGVKPVFTKAGNYMTSIEMAGISLTIFELAVDKWLDYLYYPIFLKKYSSKQKIVFHLKHINLMVLLDSWIYLIL